jgi:hypothetical protein
MVPGFPGRTFFRIHDSGCFSTCLDRSFDGTFGSNQGSQVPVVIWGPGREIGQHQHETLLFGWMFQAADVGEASLEPGCGFVCWLLVHRPIIAWRLEMGNKSMYPSLEMKARFTVSHVREKLRSEGEGSQPFGWQLPQAVHSWTECACGASLDGWQAPPARR